MDSVQSNEDPGSHLSGILPRPETWPSWIKTQPPLYPPSEESIFIGHIDIISLCLDVLINRGRCKLKQEH